MGSSDSIDLARPIEPVQTSIPGVQGVGGSRDVRSLPRVSERRSTACDTARAGAKHFELGSGY